jgi:uncharacterized protein involved in outer membrane biogenesis
VELRKKVVRYLLGAVAGIFLLMTLVVGVLYFYQDKIIQLFLAEANQHIKTKVAVEKIEVTWWEQFPQIAISLHNVEITEAVPGSTRPLAKLKKIYSTFAPWDLLGGSYQIREIHLQDGNVDVRVLPNGDVNYLFFQTADTTQEGKLSFDLQHIGLKRVHLVYADEHRRQRYEVQAHTLTAALEVAEPLIKIKTKGNAFIYTLNVQGSEFLKQKEITVASQLAIHTQRKQISVQPSDLQIGKAVYQLGGEIGYGKQTVLNMTAKGKNTDVQSMLALLPPRLTRQLAQYRSNGDIYFEGTVKGEVSSRKSPFIDVFFGARGASFYHPEYKEKIEGLALEGRFTNGVQHSSQTSVLELRNLKGNLRGKPFSGQVVYKNFADPHLQVQLKADVDVAHVLGIFPVAEIRSGSGQMQVELAFAGNLRAFKNNPSSAAIKADGEAVLRQVNLQFRKHPTAFRGLNGTFILRKNDVAVSDFSGRMGDSDFLVNGYFKNVLAWAFLKGQHLRIEADVASRSMNLDQILAASEKMAAAEEKEAGRPTNSSYAFNMPTRLELDLNASISRVQFRRFRGKQLHGQIRLKDKVLSTPNFALQAAGGSFKVRGSMDARNPRIKISSTATLTDIKVDTLFYVFENFGQSFITQRHLHGDLSAQIDSDIYLDHTLTPLTNLVQAEIKMNLRNGQLLDFAPMQKLSAFIDRRELSNLRFSEIRNNFYIQGRTVYIPEMEIKSSATRLSSISVSGTHTFDQVMDYRVRIPLGRGPTKRDKDERFGVVAASTAPNPNLFLTIKGREGNFKVAYDQEKVKTKVAADLKQEKQELKQLIQQGGKKEEKKAVKPSTEYFDF